MSTLNDLFLAWLGRELSENSANILNGYQSFAATTAATTILTIPAGRTWKGKISASCATRITAGAATSGDATALFSVSGAGAVPLGNIFSVQAYAGANAATGTVGAEGNNFGSMDVTIAAPEGNSVAIQVATNQTGSGSSVAVAASGVLL